MSNNLILNAEEMKMLSGFLQRLNDLKKNTNATVSESDTDETSIISHEHSSINLLSDSQSINYESNKNFYNPNKSFQSINELLQEKRKNAGVEVPPNKSPFRSIKDDKLLILSGKTTDVLSTSSPESCHENIKHVKPVTKLSKIKQMCEKILETTPCSEFEPQVKFIAAFGYSGFLSDNGKPLIYEEMCSKLNTNEEIASEIFKVLQPEKKIRKISNTESFLKIKKEFSTDEENCIKEEIAECHGENESKMNDYIDNECNRKEKSGDCIPRKNKLVNYSRRCKKSKLPLTPPTRPLNAKSLAKHVSEKRNKLLNDKELYKVKLEELKTKLKNAMEYQKCMRYQKRPKSRFDIAEHELIGIYAEIRNFKKFCQKFQKQTPCYCPCYL